MRPELQDVVDEASALLGADTTLEDVEFTLIAYGSQRFDVDAVRQSSILRRYSTRRVRDWFEQFGISRSVGPLRTPPDPEQGLAARLCFPVRAHGITYGYLWALDEETTLDSPQVRRVEALAERAAAFLAQLSRQSQDDAYAVSDLLSTDVDKVDQAALRVEQRGLLRQGQSAQVVWVVASRSPLPTGFAPHLWSLPRSVLVHRGPQSATLVVPLQYERDDDASRQVAEHALRVYGEELPPEWPGRLVAGIGDPRPRLTEVRASWVEARLAARVVAAVPERGPVGCWAELGLYRLLASVPPQDLVPLLHDAPVRALLASADEDLIRTVAVYLELAGNVHDAAAALHVHRQTLYYRLSKVENLTGLSFASGDDRLRLHLALMLEPLLREDASADLGTLPR